MTQQTLSRLQQIFVESDRRFALAAVIALCLAAGLLVGAYVALLSPIFAIAGVVVIVGGLLVLRDTQWGLMALIGLICLLPFNEIVYFSVISSQGNFCHLDLLTQVCTIKGVLASIKTSL